MEKRRHEKKTSFFLTNISKGEVKMSEKTKITLQIESDGEFFEVEIDSDSTVLQLTKKVAEKVLELKDQYPDGFLLIFCGHIINVRILKDEKITSIPVFDHEKNVYHHQRNRLL